MPGRMRTLTSRFALSLVAVTMLLLASARPAAAIPAFAPKYGTSCQTCHVVFPKLTPFGEAFRRNGYRFPGGDSAFVKMEPVPLGPGAWQQLFPSPVRPS